MHTIEERNKDFYSDTGLKALRGRLKSFIGIYNDPDNAYPLKIMMLGFGTIIIDSRDELGARIKELANIVGQDIEEATEIVKSKYGRTIETKTAREV